MEKIILLLSIIASCIMVFSVYTINAMHKYMPQSGKKPDSAVKNKIEYTNQVLDFIKQFTMQMAIIKYRSFIDGHEIDKITELQIQHVVEDTAVDVNKYIKYDLIDNDNLMVNSDFIDNYIIQTSIIAIKDLLDKSINNY